MRVSALEGRNIDAVKESIIRLVPEDALQEPPLVADLIRPGSTVVLVVPIDLGAPKGRLILPQVQVIREALDADAICTVVKERELSAALENLRTPPALVICDSQVVMKAAADTPPEVPLTTFSILMARFKADLDQADRRGGRDPPAQAGRPGADRRGLHPRPHLRRHRTGQDPALAATVRRRRAADRLQHRQVLSRGDRATTISSSSAVPAW